MIFSDMNFILILEIVIGVFLGLGLYEITKAFLIEYV